MSIEARRAAQYVREQRVLYDDELYPHPARLAGRKLFDSAPSVVTPYGAPLLGTVGVTTVAGTDPYSGIDFPAGTTIAGPFEAGFDSLINVLLTWLGCNPASRGYLSGGIDTATYDSTATLPAMPFAPVAAHPAPPLAGAVPAPDAVA